MPDPAPPAPPAPPPRFDLRLIFETLRTGKAVDGWLEEWLTASYAAPDAFRAALYAYVAARRRGMKSRLGNAYDLYHDCVVANLGPRRTALAVRESGALEELSFETLHRSLHGALRGLEEGRGRARELGLPGAPRRRGPGGGAPHGAADGARRLDGAAARPDLREAPGRGARARPDRDERAAAQHDAAPGGGRPPRSRARRPSARRPRARTRPTGWCSASSPPSAHPRRPRIEVPASGSTSRSCATAC